MQFILKSVLSPKKKKEKKRDLPVDGYGHQSEDAGAYRENRDELGDLAVERSERPVAVEHVGVIEGDIQGRHHGVRDAEVHQEVVGDSAHPPVSQHDPYHYQIAASRHRDHAGEQERPDHLPPPRKHELIPRFQIGVVSAVVIGIIVIPCRCRVPEVRRSVVRRQVVKALHHEYRGLSLTYVELQTNERPSLPRCFYPALLSYSTAAFARLPRSQFCVSSRCLSYLALKRAEPPPGAHNLHSLVLIVRYSLFFFPSSRS